NHDHDKNVIEKMSVCTDGFAATGCARHVASDRLSSARLSEGRHPSFPNLTHEKICVIGLPAAIGRGRGSVSYTSGAGSIPRAQNIVAAMSSGETGSEAGKAPIRSLAPKT